MPARSPRLARFRTRVAAEEITTDARGRQLLAERQVEATLLPDNASRPAVSGPFRADEAIHFVSEELDSSKSGNLLVFTGQVRGWQGERNLASERLTLDRERQNLLAEGSVVSRMPRTAGQGAAGGLALAVVYLIAVHLFGFDKVLNWHDPNPWAIDIGFLVGAAGWFLWRQSLWFSILHRRKKDLSRL